jgi:hypothetical protein
MVASVPALGIPRPGGGASAAQARPAPAAKTGAAKDTFELSDEAKAKVAELKKIDARVRAHEAAHLGAAAGLARGGATFTYTRGPDGPMYAIGGEVSVDVSAVPGDPQATLAKAQRIQAAALAPSDPSAQDRATAAAAAAMAAQASMELAKGQTLDLQA